MNKKNLPTPSSGRGSVQTGHGKPGGPAFGAYATIPGRGSSAPFARAAAVAGHNQPSQSVPQRRPTQDQMRDNPGQYSAPRMDYTAAASRLPPERRPEHATGRASGTADVGPPQVPMNQPAGPPGLQLGHDGRVPYAGREPMMARYASASVAFTADQPPCGQGQLEQGHDGPVRASGNSPGSFDARGDQTPAPSQEGPRVRDAVRALSRSRGGVPADLEAPTSRGRSGGLMTSMESHQAGAEGIGVYPAGATRGTGMESHDGPRDAPARSGG